MIDDILIGREEEYRLISAMLDKRESLVIFGKKGAGKSSIIESVLKAKNIGTVFYSSDSNALKGTLRNLISSASGDKQIDQGQNVLALKKIFYKILDEKNPEYIVFDNIGKVRPKFYSFFEYLIDREIPLIVICRGIRRCDIGCLWMSSFYFKKIEITNLDKAKTDLLVDHYFKVFGIKVARKDEFKKEVFHFSEGNPKIIKQFCFLARDMKYQKSELVNVKLMDLDRRINKLVF